MRGKRPHVLQYRIKSFFVCVKISRCYQQMKISIFWLQHTFFVLVFLLSWLRRSGGLLRLRILLILLLFPSLICGHSGGFSWSSRDGSNLSGWGFRNRLLQQRLKDECTASNIVVYAML